MSPAPLLAALLLSGGPASEDPLDLFAESNRLFDTAHSEEELRRAAAGYRQLIESGIRNRHLYYNLGNTHLRLRDLGQAILNFRRALLYEPGDPYSSAMLEYARRQVRAQDVFPGAEEGGPLRILFFWHFRSTLLQRLGALTWLLIAAWILLGARLFVRLPLHRFAAGSLFAIAAALGISVAIDFLGQRSAEAVIVASEVEVRSGSGAQYDRVFEQPIHSGVEVRILTTRNQWRQVEFPGGTLGWIPAAAAEPVAEPRP